ncbi:putative GNAT family acetyltransferase [Dactylonectria estremocensis]|uniref:GNAT family acetyltransferase n=1 Tax=Dactylonectria estremocensis TaxID=1079267 RepID=A0A9P9ICK8_9HYPO|nr:putative GNAT family acetyltransferase [Dactylonectria estremocensis]
MAIRPATLGDLSAITGVVLETLSTEATWKDHFPPKARQDAKYIQYTETILRRYLDPTNEDYMVTVVEVTDQGRCQSKPQIVSVAVWGMSFAKTGKQGQSDSLRKDVAPGDDIIPNMPEATDDCSMAKVIAVTNAIPEGRNKYFGSTSHIFLHILATKPDRQKRGYAKALCKWGMEFARKKDVVIALLTSPRGYIFFSGLGFVDVGALHLPVGHENGEHLLKAMLFDPKRAPRHGSFVDQLLHYLSS